jgi:hypothetical protein
MRPTHDHTEKLRDKLRVRLPGGFAALCAEPLDRRAQYAASGIGTQRSVVLELLGVKSTG